MKARFTLSAMIATALFVPACRSNNNSSPPIDSPAGGDSPVGGSDAGSSGSDSCTSYTVSTIAAMRGSAHSGCFELDDVVMIAGTGSQTAKDVTFYVQDSAGGDFSAIAGFCESASTSHPCPNQSVVAGAATNDKLTLKGLYEISSSNGDFEEFLPDTITDGGAGTAPAKTVAALADIERNATNAKIRFQYITTTLSTPLEMYDWTPVEFQRSPLGSACPFQFGFGMIPQGTTGSNSTPGAACTGSGSANQPTGQSDPNAAEVLIGTDFFDSFKVSTDCGCVEKFGDMAPTSTSVLSGSIKGILVYEVQFGAAVGYTYVAPVVPGDAPITNTTATP